MAKWGEGDPRWIVEERPDATNVNNWHWTEKNASVWSKDKIKELFVDMSIEDVVGDITLTEIEKMEGDAVANNRKAKLIFFYEWVIDIKFKSKSNNVEGTIHIPNLSEEHDAHEVDVDIAITKGKGLEADAVKEMLRTKGTALIRDKLALYIKSLKEEFSQGLILPTKDKANGAPTPTVKPAAATAAGTAKANEANMANMQRLALGTKLDVKSLELTESFKCQAFELYNALTVTEMVQAFTRSNVKLEASPGGKFSLFEGSISGEFTELVLNKKIVQKWRSKAWPDGHYSLATVEFEEKGDCTELHLKQTSVPANDLERTREGWQRYYWEAMKKTFGFGSFLM